MARKPFCCSASEVEGREAWKAEVVGEEEGDRGNQFAVTILLIKLIAASATSLNAIIFACCTKSAKREGLWLR